MNKKQDLLDTLYPQFESVSNMLNTVSKRLEGIHKQQCILDNPHYQELSSSFFKDPSKSLLHHFHSRQKILAHCASQHLEPKLSLAKKTTLK